MPPSLRGNQRGIKGGLKDSSVLSVEKQLLKEGQTVREREGEREPRDKRVGPWDVTTLHRLFGRKGKGTVLNTHSVPNKYRHKMFIA